MSVVAIVLAGGASRRFGGNKLAADLGGRPVLAHAVATATTLADRVILVIGPEDAAPSFDRVDLVRDAVARGGPLAGLVTGLEALGPDAEVVLALAGDMPMVRADVVHLLVAALQADPAVAGARLESEPPATLPAVLRPAIALPAARRLLAADRRSLYGLLEAIHPVVVPSDAWRALDPDGVSLRDIDTPSDLAEA